MFVHCKSPIKTTLDINNWVDRTETLFIKPWEYQILLWVPSKSRTQSMVCVLDFFLCFLYFVWKNYQVSWSNKHAHADQFHGVKMRSFSDQIHQPHMGYPRVLHKAVYLKTESRRPSVCSMSGVEKWVVPGIQTDILNQLSILN